MEFGLVGMGVSELLVAGGCVGGGAQVELLKAQRRGHSKPEFPMQGRGAHSAVDWLKVQPNREPQMVEFISEQLAGRQIAAVGVTAQRQNGLSEQASCGNESQRRDTQAFRSPFHTQPGRLPQVTLVNVEQGLGKQPKFISWHRSVGHVETS